MAKDKSISITSVIPSIQSTNRQLALRNIGKVVVVRTLASTFTGCLLSVNPTFLRLRIFSARLNRFIIIRIPFSIIVAIRLLRCASCN